MRGKSPERIPLASACGPCGRDCSHCPLVNSSVTPSLLDSRQSLGFQEREGITKRKPVFFGEPPFYFRKGVPISDPRKESVCPKCGGSKLVSCSTCGSGKLAA